MMNPGGIKAAIYSFYPEAAALLHLTLMLN
jgi:hypothetical protein